MVNATPAGMFPGDHETGLPDVGVVPELRRAHIWRHAYTQRFQRMGQFFTGHRRYYLAENCGQLSILLAQTLALVFKKESSSRHSRETTP